MNKTVFLLIAFTLMLGVHCDSFTVKATNAFKCNGKNPSDSTICSKKGTCIAQDICDCHSGYRGADCELAPYQNCKKLDSHFVEWNLKASSIEFRVTTTSGGQYGWAGIGFNNDMVMKGGALILGYLNNSKTTGNDVYEYNSPGHDVYVSKEQRLTGVSTKTVRGQLVQTFERRFKDVTDSTYFELKNETIYFLAASHSTDTPLYNTSVMKHDYYGVYQFNLFESHPCSFECYGKNSTDNNVCSGNGTCYYDNTCLCKNNNYGYACQDEIFNCYGALSTNITVCSSKGKCIGPNQCSCQTNYLGDQCETYHYSLGSTTFVSYFLLFVMVLFYVLG
eukprot:gene4133-7443_t